MGRLGTLLATLFKILKYGKPSHIISFGAALGDNLLLTVLVKALRDRGYDNIWIKSDHFFLFRCNPDVKYVMPYQTLLSTFILKFFKVEMVGLKYTIYHEETDADEVPDKHIVLKMADALGIRGEIRNKPVFYVDPAIRGTYFLAGQIVIVSSGAAAKIPMKNKEWVAGRHQEIVNRLSGRFHFIQLGAADDPPLENVLDLRGKTTIAESAAILQNSMLFIGQVGLMMHLASAVDCRSVIIFGGRERPDQSGYAHFENLYNAVPCAPCWLRNTCDQQKKCMELITVDDVEQAILSQLKMSGEKLKEDWLFNV